MQPKWNTGDPREFHRSIFSTLFLSFECVEIHLCCPTKSLLLQEPKPQLEISFEEVFLM